MKTLKKILYILLIAFLFVSCENENDVKTDLEILKEKRVSLQKQVQTLSNSKVSKSKEIILLNIKLKELKIYESGKTPQYILKIHLKQSHFSLSIKKHAKDAMNAIDFEIPVAKNFYHSVKIGTKITDKFRSGSFLLYGSFGNWNMTIKDKQIR